MTNEAYEAYIFARDLLLLSLDRGDISEAEYLERVGTLDGEYGGGYDNCL